MFANFSFPSSDDSPKNLELPYDYREMTPPMSPCHTANDEPDYFTENPLADTLSSLALTPERDQQREYQAPLTPPPSASSYRRRGTAFLPPSPDSSDDEAMDARRSLEVRSKRQAFAALQTDDEMLRSLGELVKRIGSSGSGAAGARKNSVVEGGGVCKKTKSGAAKVHVRVRTTERKAKSDHHHHHHNFGGMRLWCSSREQRRGTVVEI